MGTRYNKYELCYIVLFISLFFQSILGQISTLFEISDELFACMGLAVILQRISRKIIWKEYPRVKRIISISISVAMLGWISTIVYRVQPSTIVNLIDCFTILKIYLVFFFSLYLLQHSHLNKIIPPICKIAGVYIIIGFIFLLISQVVDIGMSFERRFGFNDFKFINVNPGDYSSILIIALATFHISSNYMHKKLSVLKLLTIILLIFTFRGKALGFIVTYFMVVLLLNKYNSISKKSLLVLGILGFLGGYFQIRYYFLDNVTPRALFLIYGIAIANEHFPLGAGFSTYGSNMAKVHYSPLYTQYGFNNIWGMNEEEPQFLNDNFWPMIMGQYGWISVLLYAFILVIIFKMINTEIKSKQLKKAGFSIFFLLLYSSIGGPIFIHYIGCASIIILSLIIKGNKLLKE